MAITPISTPRTTPVSTVTVTFAGAVPVTGFTINNVVLTKNGNPVTLPAGATVTQVNDTTWNITGLSSATSGAGTYVLSINPTPILDANGNPVTGGEQSVTFVVQAAPPPVTPPVIPSLPLAFPFRIPAQLAVIRTYTRAFGVLPSTSAVAFYTRALAVGVKPETVATAIWASSGRLGLFARPTFTSFLPRGPLGFRFR